MGGERTGAPPVDGALQQAGLGRHASPWREVVHIEMQVNSHGRDCYWLTLECGHHKYASIPGITMIPELIRMRGPKRRSREAPRRCRCHVCGALALRTTDEERQAPGAT